MHVIFAVDDVARSAAFYEQVFEWPRNPRVNYSNYVELEKPGGGWLGLYERDGFARSAGTEPAHVGPGKQTATEIYVRVEDVRDVIARLQELEAPALSPLAPREWGDEAAYFADPDGNVVAVAQYLHA